MPVSSLCTTPPCAACRMISPSMHLSCFAAASINSHWVAAGNGIPSCVSSRSIRLKGTPVPYFSSAIIATAVVSYLSVPTPAGSAAVNTWQQPLQRRRSISNTVAFSGACPTMRISVFGSFCRYTLPSRHSGQGSPGLSCACCTETFSAPVKALAALRP